MGIIGIIGSVCFAVCLLPQVIRAYRDKDARSLTWSFILLSVAGNVCSFVYVLRCNLATGQYQYPLYGNYLLAFCLCCALLVAKWRF